MSDAQLVDMADAQRSFALLTNQRVWELLAKEGRSARENDELLYAAFASCYHWLQIGGNVEQQRGEYLIAKAYMSLNNAAEAMAHARKCRQITEQHRAAMQDFDIAFAGELMARACAMQGDSEEAARYYAQAQAAGNAIQDAEDRQIFESDLAAGPWFGWRAA
jgi:hypothetical protein